MSVKFENVSFLYLPKTPFEHLALDGIDLEILDGTFTAIIGHTGSGKSTLVQHINALLRPSKGKVLVGDYVIAANEKKVNKLQELRKYAGLVFQFPEYQLFEETVLKDVAFGPKNFKDSEQVALEKAKKALSLVGIEEALFDKSPFELSGGQKRRVAIAGIIALEPQILVLDEPTAGLDPQGAKEMMSLFKTINERGTTVIMITHDMDNVLKYCDRAVVMKDGKIVKIEQPSELFKDEELLKEISLEEPHIISFAKKLIASGMNLELNDIKDFDSFIAQIGKARSVK